TTLGGIAMMRDQAMGQQGLPWGTIQELFAKAYQQCCVLAAENSPEGSTVTVQIPGKYGSEQTISLSIDDLKRGKFHCFPDTDSSIPETFGARRGMLMQMMEAAAQNPLIAQIL